jgi:secondary thiamine-phosphate synthase enzyme
MKTYSKHIVLNTEKKEIINITSRVQMILHDSGIKEGMCLVNSMHTTSALFINEDEQGLKQDLLKTIEELIPQENDYKHFGDDNAHAHIKSMILGRGVTIAVSENKLELGQWEQIMFLELDGPRTRKIAVKIIGE